MLEQGDLQIISLLSLLCVRGWLSRGWLLHSAEQKNIKSLVLHEIREKNRNSQKVKNCIVYS